MKISRRSFFTVAASAGAAAAAMGHAADSPSPSSNRRIKLGISTYSYWHFHPPKVSIESVIDKASAFGVEGIDILHRQMDSEDRAYLVKLKRQAFLSGIDLICLSIHQNFVSPDASVR